MKRARRPSASFSARGSLEVLEQRIAPAALIGLDENNHLVAFDSAAPTTVTTTTVTGLGTGETLIGIDFRPATGGLYGITKDGASAGRVYLINPTTGHATLSALLVADPSDTVDGNAPFASLSGVNFGFDFNPNADRLTVVSDTHQNLRVDVDTGKVFTDLDVNTTNATAPTISGAAYTSSFAGAGTTKLYDIDVARNVLVTQDPGTGVLTDVGSLGITATGVGGLDVLSTRAADGTVTDTAFAALTVSGVAKLYGINLTTGAATLVGNIGPSGGHLVGLTASIGAPAANAFTIDDTSHLLKFNVATPAAAGGTTDLGAITGLGGGETIAGFDFRPSDGLLYLVTKDGANAAHLYTVNTQTAAATPLGTLVADVTDTTSPYTSLSGTNFGVDFDPVANVLRVVSDSGQNLHVNVATLATTTDAALNGVATATSALAHASNFAGATSTTLFDLDTTGDQLLKQTDANGGVLTTVGPLGVHATAVNGFDITTDGKAFASLTVGGVVGLYSINLTTGAATLAGALSGVTGDTHGLALAPSGSFQFSTSGLTVAEGGGTATLTINRVGGSDGTSTVLVNTATGTAGASDFTPLSQVVTFGPGVTSQTISVPITQDIAIETNESFTVTLSEPTGGAQLGTTKTSTVTIIDDEPVFGATSLIGLDGSNHLLLFNSATPGTVSGTLTVTGLGAGETLVGIDFRPETGALYGLTKDGSNAGRLYVINPTTGAASFSFLLQADPADTVDGNAAYTSLSGTKFGLDFNPVTGGLRVVSDTLQNLHVNIGTGLVFTDAALTAGAQVGESAYSNSFAGSTGTTLYNIDFATDHLVTQSPPNNGTQVDVGALGVDATSSAGFDIVSTRTADGTITNTGFAALNVNGVEGLYAVDLVTGQASFFGAIGTGSTQLIGLTSATGAPAPEAYTIDGSNNLIHFSTAAPGAPTSTTPITGLDANESVIGFDFRPSDGLAYVVTENSVDHSGHVYSLNPTSATPGVATPVSTLAAAAGDDLPYTALNGSSFGVDFNPVTGHLRIVSDTAQNLDLNVDTGEVVTDAALNSSTPAIVGAAYTNSFPGGGTVNGVTGQTKLFVIDATTDQLFLQDPANPGTLTAVGALGVDASGIGEFDIRANGDAYAVLTVGGATGLYHVNLTTGAATLAGSVPSGPSHGFALAPNVVTQFSTSTATVGEGDGTVMLTINRLNGASGTSSVIVETHSGTAVAGQDFTSVSQVVTFAPGELTKQISVPILEDQVSEANETFTVTVTDQAGDAFNAVTTSTVTITDNDALPTVSVGNVTQVEGTGGTTMFSFPVTLSGPAGADITFDYSTIAGTALAGSDFTAATAAHLTIPAGQTTGTISISVVADSTFEQNEMFDVQLSNISANATLGTTLGHGTILNDDANSITAKSVTYTDVDGDLVTIKTTVGTLSGSNFTFVPAGTHGGLQLEKIDLSSPSFLNSNLTITAKRGPTGGDGFANIGYVDAHGNTLGAVSIAGDLGQIDANAAKSLVVQSIGKLGLTTQAAGGSLQSTFVANLPVLTVRTDVVEASISALNLGTVNILGNVIGGAGDHSGSIEALNKITALTIAGTLRAGADAESGSVIAKTTGALKIREIDGGRIFVAGNTIVGGATAANNKLALALGSLTVAGSVHDADILVGYDRNGAPVNADVTTGAIVVSGDWEGSNLAVGVKAGMDGFFGSDTGTVIAGGGAVVAKIASITVRGQILGSVDDTTDRFGFVAEQIGAFTVGTTKLKLGTLATAPKDNVVIGVTDDVVVREY